MTPLARPAALILDLDGTLADSAALHAAAYRASLTRLAPSLAEAFRYEAVRALSTDEALAACGLADPRVRAEAGAEKRRLYRAAVAAGRLRPMPGARCLLAWAAAAGIPAHLATGGSAGSAAAALAALGLRGLLRTVTTVNDAGAGKPDPAIPRLAAARAGLPPAACLMVEDSAEGLAAAAAAGMPAVAVHAPALAAGPAPWFPSLCALRDALAAAPVPESRP